MIRIFQKFQINLLFFWTTKCCLLFFFQFCSKIEAELQSQLLIDIKHSLNLSFDFDKHFDIKSWFVGVICKRKLYLTDNIHLCVLNLTIAFFCQLFVVIPLSLFVLVVHNWVLGSFICYTLPIIQVCHKKQLIASLKLSKQFFFKTA